MPPRVRVGGYNSGEGTLLVHGQIAGITMKSVFGSQYTGIRKFLDTVS